MIDNLIKFALFFALLPFMVWGIAFAALFFIAFTYIVICGAAILIVLYGLYKVAKELYLITIVTQKDP